MPSYRKLFPHTVLADIPVLVLPFLLSILLFAPGNSLRFPTWRVLNAILTDMSVGAVYLVLGLMSLIGVLRYVRLALIGFGLLALWLLFVSTTALLSEPLSPGWASYLVLSGTAMVSFFRRAEAGFRRRDLAREIRVRGVPPHRGR